MQDETTIANAALGLLGANPITNFEDGTTEATWCGVFYESTVQARLAEHPWNFAETSVSLAQDASAAHADYAGSFQLPTNYIAARRILAASGYPSGYTYKIRGLKLCTDEAAPILVYTYRAPEHYWPPLFVEAVVFDLAAKLAKPLTESDGTSEAYFRLAADTLAIAKSKDSQTDSPDEIESFPLIAAHAS